MSVPVEVLARLRLIFTPAVLPPHLHPPGGTPSCCHRSHSVSIELSLSVTLMSQFAEVMSALCKRTPGHYYDLLLRDCVSCADICGRHPAECSQHCQPPTPPATTKKFLMKATSHIPNSRLLPVPKTLEDSTVLIYSLLALCMVLLLSSLSLALAVFLRESRARISKPGPKPVTHAQATIVQMVGQQECGPGDMRSRPTNREPSEDSSPTETCVCVHCFPDLTARGHSIDRPPKPPVYQQAVLQQSQTQNGGPFWTEGTRHNSGPEVQESVVG
ncbi:uncharacterized protein tnfrsf13b [Aulostomus maculatus]